MDSFIKDERLNNKIEIKELFSQGKSISINPFQLLWKTNNNTKNHFQVLISVPKRNINLATERNFLRRKIKESFRLNKKKLYKKLNEKAVYINIAIIYQKREIHSYKIIEEKINLLLTHLIKQL